MNSWTTVFTKSILSVSLMGILGCVEGAEESQASLQSLGVMEAESVAESLLAGEVIATHHQVQDGQDLYQVYIRMSNDAIVNVGIHRGNGELVNIEHMSGYPDYDLEPHHGGMRLEDALSEALYIVPGSIVSWELDIDDEYPGKRWVYEIYILALDNEIYSVEIDAATGEIIDVELESPYEDEDGEYVDVYPIPLPPTSTVTPPKKPNPPNRPVPIDAVYAAALKHVEGVVYEIEKENEYGLDAWKVEVVTSKGAVVELRLLSASLALYRAKGDLGLFDYEFIPGLDLITLQEAIYLSEVGYDSLERWRLERSDGRFIWELRFANSRVEVDAYTGFIKSRD